MSTVPPSDAATAAPRLDIAAYDRARAAIAARGFDSEIQSRISLFVGASKSINATFLGTLQLIPGRSVVQEFIHSQCCREIELATLLARATEWTPNPIVYAEMQAMTLPLWTVLWEIQSPPGPLQDARARFRGFALGHALLSRVRVTPLIPAGSDELSPYVAALRRIDQENGRQIQTQIRLLKDVPQQLAPDECETVVAQEQARVDAAFAQLLAVLVAAPSGR